MSPMSITEIRRAEREHEQAPWIVPVEHLSPSALSTLSRCPEQYRHAHVLKIKRRPGLFLTIGTANHKTHEHTLTRKMDGQETTLGDALDFFRDDAWPNAVERDGGPDNIEDWKETTHDDTIALGTGMVTAYHQGVIPRIEPTRLEEKFSIAVKGVPVPLLGYVDIQTPGPVIDLKTTSKKVTTVQPSWWLQGRVYQLFTDRPVDWHIVTKAKLPQALTPLEEPGLFQPISYEIKEQTEDWVRRLALMANTFMYVFGPDNPWPTTGVVNGNCGFCGYSGICVAWKGVER